MLTYALTCATTAALLVAGAFALLAGRAYPPGQPQQRASWLLVGAGVLTHATDKAVQNTWGGVAMYAGDRHDMEVYLRWSQVFDHSRTFLMLAAVVGLGAIALLGRAPGRGFWRLTLGAMAVSLVGGGILGWAEGGFDYLTHYSAVALSDVVELFTLMAVLMLVLVRNTVDRYLWTLLAAYGCTIALGVLWFALFAQWAQGIWQPPPWAMPLERLAFFGVMAGMAVRRWFLARNRRPVYGMLGRPLQPAIFH